jgi:hypothetical protein
VNWDGSAARTPVANAMDAEIKRRSGRRVTIR